MAVGKEFAGIELEVKKLLLLYPYALTKPQVKKLLSLVDIAGVNKWLNENGLTVDAKTYTQQEVNRLLTKSVPVVYVTGMVAEELVKEVL